MPPKIVLLIACALGVAASYFGLLRGSVPVRINSAYQASRIVLLLGLFWGWGLTLIVLLLWTRGVPWQFWVWLVIGVLAALAYGAMRGWLRPADITYVPLNVTYWMPYVGISPRVTAGVLTKAEVGLSEHSIDVRDLSMSQADVDELEAKIENGSSTVNINRVRFLERAITASRITNYTTAVSVSITGQRLRASPSRVNATIGDLVRTPVSTDVLTTEVGHSKLRVDIGDEWGSSLGGMTVPIEIVARPSYTQKLLSAAGRYLGPPLVVCACLLAIAMRAGWITIGAR